MDIRRWERRADEGDGHFAIAVALFEIAKSIKDQGEAADIIDGGLVRVADALSGISGAITDLAFKK